MGLFMAASLSRGRRKYLYDSIVETIRSMIQRGELKVGDKLPPERTLAERFNVSRNCVRQAVQALAERKVLESRQGDGTYVCAANESLLVESFALAIQTQKELLQDILEFRRMMEPEVSALAAVNITPEELDRLKVIVCDQQRKILAGEEDSQLDAAFHLALAHASRNRVVQRVMDTLTEILDESRSEYLQSEARRKASVVGHLRVIDALEKADPASAHLAMKEHLAEIEEIILGNSEVEKSWNSRK